jgi:Xaa-Pro aminopeptidase
VESHIDDTRPFPSSKEFPSLFDEAVRKIGFTFDVVPMQHYNYYAKLLAGREFTDISAINREIHSIKSVWELEQMHHSGDQISCAFAQVPEFFKPGMRELDLSAEFERSLRQLGNEGVRADASFQPRTLSGVGGLR